jgi:hypothetical protein
VTVVNSRNYASISASSTRPADTTTYAAGDLVANSTTAASVVPFSWITKGSQAFWVPGVKFFKTGTGLTGASFRLHLYSASPTVTTAGDNSAYASNVAGNANWISNFDLTLVTAHNDGCAGLMVPTEGVIRLDFQSASATLYGLLEAVGAYAPTSGETFTLWLQQEFQP